ncbi:hypothetical protein GpartN1_g2778.t1 [Galdieria partita]|uniref:Uncharacterized protein n=1 Tax=Galdieria partita TaxID=83374 RepID=A0A9C7UPY1_9RHOD|nr:hypothetical protein GpartN1_g2778.t1 [Galdieria partita]
MFHHLYEDLPAPKSSSNVTGSSKKETFAAKIVPQEIIGSDETCSKEEQISQPKKETISSSRWSTAAARMLQPPPSVLVKRQTHKVPKTVVKETKITVSSKQENQRNLEGLERDNKQVDEEDSKQVDEEEEEEEKRKVFKAQQQQETQVTSGKYWNVVDEYDPLRPNDFEACLREREWRKAQQVKSSFS